MVNRYYQFEDGGNPYSVMPRGTSVNPISSVPISMDPSSAFEPQPAQVAPVVGDDRVRHGMVSMTSPQATAGEKPIWGPVGSASIFGEGWQSRLWNPGQSYGSDQNTMPIFRSSDFIISPAANPINQVKHYLIRIPGDEAGSTKWISEEELAQYGEILPQILETKVTDIPNAHSIALRGMFDRGVVNNYFLQDLLTREGTQFSALGAIPNLGTSLNLVDGEGGPFRPIPKESDIKALQDWNAMLDQVSREGLGGFLFSIKTGGRHGRTWGYAPVIGPDGQEYYVPVHDFGYSGGKGSIFDTNADNRLRNQFLATMALMALGGALYGAYGGSAAAAGEGAIGGLSAADAAALASGWEGAVAGAAAENAALAGSAGGLLGGGLPASLGGVEGVIAGSTTPINLSAGLGTGFAGTTPMTGTLPSITPGAITGSTLAGTIPSMIPPDGGGSPWFEYPGHETIPPPLDGGNSGSPWFEYPGHETIPPLSGGNMSWTDFLNRFGQIFDNFTGERSPSTGGGNQMGLSSLLSALYGVYARDKYGDLIKGQVDRMQQMADPYLQKLRESYENPQAYLQSPEMQAVLNLEANRLAGIDASRGRLSNDFERTAKLQQLAQARLNDYRRGLQGAISSVYTPQSIAEMFKEAAKAESSRYGDLAAWVGAGGSGQQTWGDIVSWINAGKDLWDLFSSWWGD